MLYIYPKKNNALLKIIVFVVNFPSMKKVIPNLYSYIVYYMYIVDKQEAFEVVSPQIEQKLF